MAHNSLPPEERERRRQARLQARYAREREARAAKALAEGRPLGKTGPLPVFTPGERALRKAQAALRSYRRHAEERAAKAREKYAIKQAARAAEEGRGIRKIGRPKVVRTEEEARRLRREKTAAWRLANLDRYREIIRESEKRRAAAKALEEGRVPGKKGPRKIYTLEEKVAKQAARNQRYYHENLETSRERAARRARERRAEKKAGAYVSRQHPKLTPEEKRLQNVQLGQRRRARLRAAFGDGYTLKDIDIIRERQNGLCNMADCDQSLRPENETLDHVFPLALGGTHEMGNFQLLCASCNSRKGAKHPSGFKFRYSLHCW